MTSKGQVTVPKVVRDRLGIQPGDVLIFAVEGNRAEVHPQRRKTLADLAGLFPVKRAVGDAREREIAWRRETARLIQARRKTP